MDTNSYEATVIAVAPYDLRTRVDEMYTKGWRLTSTVAEQTSPYRVYASFERIIPNPPKEN